MVVRELGAKLGAEVRGRSPGRDQIENLVRGWKPAPIKRLQVAVLELCLNDRCPRRRVPRGKCPRYFVG